MTELQEKTEDGRFDVVVNVSGLDVLFNTENHPENLEDLMGYRETIQTVVGYILNNHDSIGRDLDPNTTYSIAGVEIEPEGFGRYIVKGRKLSGQLKLLRPLENHVPELLSPLGNYVPELR